MHQHSYEDVSAHSHNHGKGLSNSKMLFTLLLNLLITIVEIIGGLLSNSLALLSDALHNLSDTMAIFIAWIASIISRKEANQRKTFGYKRVEILAAFINAVVLIVVSVYLFYEAYLRFLQPEPIKGMLMIIVSAVGLLANLISVLILHSDKKKNINIKAAYLHLFGDTLSSVAVLIGGIFIWLWQVYWLDPVLTVLIGLYIIKETYSILKETIDILMQSVPTKIDLEAIHSELEQIDEIRDIHHVHVWSLDDRRIHFECHIDLKKDMQISQTDSLRCKIENLLHEKFDINHITIQMEFNFCDNKSIINGHH